MRASWRERGCAAGLVLLRADADRLCTPAQLAASRGPRSASTRKRRASSTSVVTLDSLPSARAGLYILLCASASIFDARKPAQFQKPRASLCGSSTSASSLFGVSCSEARLSPLSVLLWPFTTVLIYLEPPGRPRTAPREDASPRHPSFSSPVSPLSLLPLLPSCARPYGFRAGMERRRSFSLSRPETPPVRSVLRSNLVERPFN